MAWTKNTRVAVGGFAAVVVLLALLVRIPSGDVDTNVILEDREALCVVATKSDVTIKKNKKLSWVIDNRCTNNDELVTVGNFRMAQGSTATNCLQPTEGSGVQWPFQEDINDLSKRQHKNKIQLKIKKDSDLAGEQLTYYFDICTGPNAERKSDPRLVIER